MPSSFTTLEQRFNQSSDKIYGKFSAKSDGGNPLLEIKPNSKESRTRMQDDNRGVPLRSTKRDTTRISRFLTSRDGVLFLGKQLLLQTGNTFAETRLYNPLSVLINAIPFVHWPRQISKSLLSKTPSRKDRGALQGETVNNLTGQGSGLLERILKRTSPVGAVLDVFKSNITEFKGFYKRPEDTQFYNSDTYEAKLMDRTPLSTRGDIKGPPTYTTTLTNVDSGIHSVTIPQSDYVLFRLGKLKPREVRKNSTFGKYLPNGTDGYINQFTSDDDKRKNTTFVIYNNGVDEVMKADYLPLSYSGSRYTDFENKFKRYTKTEYTIFGSYYSSPRTSTTSVFKGGSNKIKDVDLLQFTAPASPNGRKFDSTGTPSYPAVTTTTFSDNVTSFSKYAQASKDLIYGGKLSDATVKDISVINSVIKIDTFEKTDTKKFYKQREPHTDKTFLELQNKSSAQGYFKNRPYIIGIREQQTGSTLLQDEYNLSPAPSLALSQLLLAADMVDYTTISGEKEPKSDIVKFIFQSANEVEPPVHFRALISKIQQNVKPQFNEQQYVGRIERFVTYAGVKRDVNMEFDIVAFSQDELKNAWTRINYLTGLAFPKRISAGGFIVPPLFKITVGGIYENQPCYIEDLSFEFMDQNNTFDIDSEVSQTVHVTLRMSLLEKRTKIYDSAFYAILEEAERSRTLPQVPEAQVPGLPALPTTLPDRTVDTQQIVPPVAPTAVPPAVPELRRVNPFQAAPLPPGQLRPLTPAVRFPNLGRTGRALVGTGPTQPTQRTLNGRVIR